MNDNVYVMLLLRFVVNDGREVARFGFLVEEREESAATANVAGFSLRFEEGGEGFVFGGGERFGAAELREEGGGGGRAARGGGGAEYGFKCGGGSGGCGRFPGGGGGGRGVGIEDGEALAEA